MMDTIFRQYYGENYNKAMRLADGVREEMRMDILKKYPNTGKQDYKIINT